MKIVSPYKDYYDYLAHIYGQDNHVVYLRGEIVDATRKTHFSMYCHHTSLCFPEFYNCVDVPNHPKWHFRFLVVCGRQYLCVRKRNENMDFTPYPWEIYDAHKHSDIQLGFKPRYSWQGLSNKSNAYYKGEYNPKLIELSKLLQQPVFFIDGNTGSGDSRVVLVNSFVPKLGELGFASIMTAEKLYQDIEYFIGNTLKDNPDIAPPVNVSDKDLIVAKGFDIKKSFRKDKQK